MRIGYEVGSDGVRVLRRRVDARSVVYIETDVRERKSSVRGGSVGDHCLLVRERVLGSEIIVIPISLRPSFLGTSGRFSGFGLAYT